MLPTSAVGLNDERYFANRIGTETSYLRSGQRHFQGGVFSGKNGASGIHETK